MPARTQVVGGVANLFLLLFCSPILALAIGIAMKASPGSLPLKVFVGLTNTEVLNAIHTLLLPLIGAMIIFRDEKLGTVN